jgi:hypothetical protein
MAAETNPVGDAIDRVEEALRSASDEFDRLKGKAEKRFSSFEKEAQKRLEQFRSDFVDTDFGKRAESLRADATSKAEAGIETILGSLGVASSKEAEKLDRKLSRISRRLKKLEVEKVDSPQL